MRYFMWSVCKATSESVAADVVARAWQGRILLLGEGAHGGRKETGSMSGETGKTLLGAMSICMSLLL